MMLAGHPTLLNVATVHKVSTHCPTWRGSALCLHQITEIPPRISWDPSKRPLWGQNDLTAEVLHQRKSSNPTSRGGEFACTTTQTLASPLCILSSCSGCWQGTLPVCPLQPPPPFCAHCPPYGHFHTASFAPFSLHFDRERTADQFLCSHRSGPCNVTAQQKWMGGANELQSVPMLWIVLVLWK